MQKIEIDNKRNFNGKKDRSSRVRSFESIIFFFLESHDASKQLTSVRKRDLADPRARHNGPMSSLERSEWGAHMVHLAIFFSFT